MKILAAAFKGITLSKESHGSHICNVSRCIRDDHLTVEDATANYHRMEHNGNSYFLADAPPPGVKEPSGGWRHTFTDEDGRKWVADCDCEIPCLMENEAEINPNNPRIQKIDGESEYLKSIGIPADSVDLVFAALHEVHERFPPIIRLWAASRKVKKDRAVLDIGDVVADATSAGASITEDGIAFVGIWKDDVVGKIKWTEPLREYLLRVAAKCGCIDPAGELKWEAALLHSMHVEGPTLGRDCWPWHLIQ